MVVIRDERSGDENAVRDLTERAFAPMAFSDGSEPAIVDALRQAGNLTISLVAEDDGGIIGHVAFSPVKVDGAEAGWFGLGPISVEPARQRQGIGKALMAQGLDRLRAKGASGCALIGSPDVYRGSGFISDGQLAYGDLDRRYVMRIVFFGAAPQGILKFAPAFQQGKIR